MYFSIFAPSPGPSPPQKKTRRPRQPPLSPRPCYGHVSQDLWRHICLSNLELNSEEIWNELFVFSNLSLKYGVAFTAFNISEVTLRVTNIVTVDPVSHQHQLFQKNLVRFTNESIFMVW